MTLEWHSSSKEGEEAKDGVDKEKELVEVTRPETWELMLVEAEAQVMQVPSQGDPEEIPLKQTAEESRTATTAEQRTLGRMIALIYQTNSSNNSK